MGHNFNDEELMQMVEHVDYELTFLLKSVEHLNFFHQYGAVYYGTIFLETYLLHLRNILDFFERPNSSKDNDLFAEYYLSESQKDNYYNERCCLMVSFFTDDGNSTWCSEKNNQEIYDSYKADKDLISERLQHITKGRLNRNLQGVRKSFFRLFVFAVELLEIFAMLKPQHFNQEKLFDKIKYARKLVINYNLL